MKFKMFVLLSVLTFSFFSINLYAQTVGKIFSKNEANTLFGSVLESKAISISELKSVMNQTNQYLMFLIKDGAIAIKGDGGNVIYNGGVVLTSSDVFIKYSKSVLIELLYLSTDENVYIEKRSSVTTVSNNGNTLELGQPCPPFCG